MGTRQVVDLSPLARCNAADSRERRAVAPGSPYPPSACRSRCMALMRSRDRLTNSPVASTFTTPSWRRRPVLKVRRSVTSVTHDSKVVSIPMMVGRR